jgi:DNA-binding FadR family transcriptional regulator
MKTRNDPRRRPSPEVAHSIRQYIVRHRLKPGDLLPTQDELSEKLDLGIRRLREGLSILKHQGFIETRGKGGTFVRRPSFESLSKPITWHLDATGYRFEDLVLARAGLESAAAGEAAERRSARDLLTILDALEQLEARPEAESDLAEDESFHLAIMEATHNPVTVTFGQLVRIQFQGKDTHPELPALREAANHEHRRIYEAIERQDRAAARDLMYAHVMGQLQADNLEK